MILKYEGVPWIDRCVIGKSSVATHVVNAVQFSDALTNLYRRSQCTSALGDGHHPVIRNPSTECRSRGRCDAKKNFSARQSTRQGFRDECACPAGFASGTAVSFPTSPGQPWRSLAGLAEMPFNGLRA
jgi:hypothetical protein